MITAFINSLVSFFNSLVSLVVLWFLLKLCCWYFFRFKLRIPRFRKARNIQVALGAKRYSKADYEFRKFKYETKLKCKQQYKLEKLRIKLEKQENHKMSSKIASLPAYLRIVK